MMAIIYERVKGPLRSNRSQFVGCRLIILGWILPIFQGIFNVFTTMSLREKDDPKNLPSVHGSCVSVSQVGFITFIKLKKLKVKISYFHHH